MKRFFVGVVTLKIQKNMFTGKSLKAMTWGESMLERVNTNG